MTDPADESAAVDDHGVGVLTTLLREAAARRVLADPTSGEERRSNARRALGLPAVPANGRSDG